MTTHDCGTVGAFVQIWVPFSSKITISVIDFRLDHFDPCIGAISLRNLSRLSPHASADSLQQWLWSEAFSSPSQRSSSIFNLFLSTTILASRPSVVCLQPVSFTTLAILSSSASNPTFREGSLSFATTSSSGFWRCRVLSRIEIERSPQKCFSLASRVSWSFWDLCNLFYGHLSPRPPFWHSCYKVSKLQVVYGTARCLACRNTNSNNSNRIAITICLALYKFGSVLVALRKYPI